MESIDNRTQDTGRIDTEGVESASSDMAATHMEPRQDSSYICGS